MKNLKYAIVLGLGFFSLLSAQTTKSGDTNDLTFGFKAGLNLSNVYDKEGQNFVASSKVGFVGGVFVNLPLGQYFSVQPEMLFSQKGFKGEGTLLGSNYNYERSTTFLDIPILLSFKPISSVALLFGPQYSFLLSEKNTFSTPGGNLMQEQQFNNDNVRKNIFGLTGGVDFNATDNIVVGLRAGWDLQQNNGDGTNTTPRYRNVWYQATLGYRF